uniref:Ataxin-2-like protein n=1 Tax=Lygus hesperus TaxID=30085 RepID=A0A0A9YLE1_LYGHE
MSLKEEDERLSKPQTVGILPERPPQNEGVFSRPNFAKTVTSLIGNNVKVKTKTGSTYEGIFTSLSSNFEVIIALTHKVEPTDPFYNKVDSDTIIFKSEDIVSISCVNVNLKEALDLSQRLEISGDFSGKRDCESWESTRGNDDPDLHPYVDKAWNMNQHLRPVSSDFDDDLKGYHFYSRSVDYIKEPKMLQNKEDYPVLAQSPIHDSAGTRGDYPKPQRNPKFTESGSIITDEFSTQEVRRIEKSSSLNPYAKPFTPKEAAGCDKQSTMNPSIPSLATVVLPTYCVSGNNNQMETARYGKSDGQGLAGAPPSLLGSGNLQNQYMPGYSPYGDGYDEKLYSAYDSLPLSAHEYQQYYPHLQYIQYFRRFY